jgi:hypothetical protein
MQRYLEHVVHELYMTEMEEDQCGGMGGLEKDIIARLQTRLVNLVFERVFGLLVRSNPKM